MRSVLHSRGKEKESLTSQNSRMNCLHMPQGLAGGEMSVATAMARKSPVLAPCWKVMWSVDASLRIKNTKQGQFSYVLSHSRSNRHPLSASSNGIRGVLDIGSRHDGAAGQQQSTADVELRVGA